MIGSLWDLKPTGCATSSGNEDEMIEAITLSLGVYENLKEIYATMMDRV